MRTWSGIGNQANYQTKVKKSTGSRRWLFSMTLKVLLTLAIVFFIGVKRISCNEKANRLSREIAKVRQEIHLQERIIENLRMQRERYTDFRYIQGRNTSLSLGLRPALSSQLRKTVLLRNPEAESFVSDEMRTASYKR